MLPWRMVEVCMTTTVACPEVGPWSPLGFAGNRGQPGPPEWGWRGSDRSFHWETGTPPAAPGVLCDSEWRPFSVDEMANLVPPPCGFHRSQAHRQKKAAASTISLTG